MTLSELLTYLSDATRFPFFNGWVAPQGRNPTKTVDGVVLDEMAADGDTRYRAYYRKVQGIRCDTTPINIRVVAEGTENEAAYIASLSPVAEQSATLVPLWRIAELARKEGWWLTAKAAVTTNQYAAAFFDYYADSRFENLDISLDASKAVLAGLVSTELLTQAQADAIEALTTIAVSDFS